MYVNCLYPNRLQIMTGLDVWVQLINSRAWHCFMPKIPIPTKRQFNVTLNRTVVKKSSFRMNISLLVKVRYRKKQITLRWHLQSSRIYSESWVLYCVESVLCQSRLYFLVHLFQSEQRFLGRNESFWSAITVFLQFCLHSGARELFPLSNHCRQSVFET